MNIDTLQTRQHIKQVARPLPLFFLLLAVLLPSAGLAQQPAAAQPAAPAQGSASPVTAPGEEKPKTHAPGNIHIHGHWKIDVRNPDGSLDRHVEFDNSLFTGGQGDMVLASLLTGQAVISDWIIGLSSPAPLCDLNHAGCILVQSSSFPLGASTCSTVGAYCVPNLTTLFSQDPTTGFLDLTLSGFITVAENTQISFVQTGIGFCKGTLPTTKAAQATYIPTAPAACQASSITAQPTGSTIAASAFSGTPKTLNVTTGQLVQVFVVISFT